jgi:hypothetical protein
VFWASLVCRRVWQKSRGGGLGFPRIFAQREVHLTIQAPQRQTRLTRAIANPPLPRHARFIMLLHISCTFQERAPALHLLEVHILPEPPARILDIQRTRAGQQQDGGLQRVRVRRDVHGEQVDGFCGQAREEEAGE